MEENVTAVIGDVRLVKKNSYEEGGGRGGGNWYNVTET
jgi:hypothetical protein